MWDGINVKNGGELVITGGTLIEDAIMGAYIAHGAAYTIENSIFNRNYYHVVVFNTALYSPTYGPGSISNTQFRCQTTASLGGSPVYENLKSPHENDISLVGVLAVNSEALTMTGCEVSNAEYGVFAQMLDDLTISGGTFEDLTEVAIYVTESGSGDVDLIGNEVYRTSFGIVCYDNAPSEMKIEGNLVSFAGMTSPPQQMTGIFVDEITPASPNKVSIVDNDVFNAPCGIHVRNLAGAIDLSGLTGSVFIGENDITHSKTPNDAQSGILVQNCTQALIVDNDVTHPTPSVNWWETAIRVSGNTHFLSCNRVNDIGNGLFFDGDVRPLTILMKNTMSENNNGIFLNYSKIGTQGSSGAPFDNIWDSGSSWSSGSPQILSYNSDGTASPFTVQTPGADYYPTHRTLVGSGSAVPTPGTTSSASSVSCPWFSAPSYKLDGEQNSPDADGLADMLVQEIEGMATTRDSTQFWNGQYGLYKKLLTDEQLKTGSAALGSFFTTMDQGSMGNLHRALEGFTQLRGGAAVNGQGLGNIFSELAQLSRGYRVESRLSEVLWLLYPNLPDLRAMSSSSLERLREIALMCPLDEGLGVYVARSGLMKIDTVPRGYMSDCEKVPNPNGFERGRKSIESEGVLFRIYPNPNQGTMNLEYELSDGEKGFAEVFSLTGQRVYAQQLQNGTTRTVLELTGLRSGIYLVRVMVDGQVRLTERVSVLSE